MLSIFVARATFLDNGDSDARCQLPHSRWKIDMLVIHYETKNAPAHAAAKTMKCLPGWAHNERRRLFLMKWAERLEIYSGTFQRKIRADHLDDVVGGRDLLYGF